jgi:hypothetical protein
LGACGINSDDNSEIVSISHFTFDAAQKGSDPNANPLCGRKIRAQRVNNGKQVSVDLTVVDRCEYIFCNTCRDHDSAMPVFGLEFGSKAFFSSVLLFSLAFLLEVY